MHLEGEPDSNFKRTSYLVFLAWSWLVKVGFRGKHTIFPFIYILERFFFQIANLLNTKLGS